MIITRAMPTQQTAIIGVSRRITAGQEFKAGLCRAPALIPRKFSTAPAANAWCDSEGFAIDNCLAKRLSHTDGPDGSTVERG